MEQQDVVCPTLHLGATQEAFWIIRVWVGVGKEGTWEYLRDKPSSICYAKFFIPRQHVICMYCGSSEVMVIYTSWYMQYSLQCRKPHSVP